MRPLKYALVRWAHMQIDVVVVLLVGSHAGVGRMRSPAFPEEEA
ncbi:MAG: hypothetical protein AAFV53_34025 [Myxococcota bacterium]